MLLKPGQLLFLVAVTQQFFQPACDLGERLRVQFLVRRAIERSSGRMPALFFRDRGGSEGQPNQLQLGGVVGEYVE